MKRLKTLYAVTASLCLLAVNSQAAITGLFNTGVDAGGVSAADGSSDLHYTLVVVPGGTTVTRVRNASGGPPIPPWLGDSPISSWIGPNNSPALVSPVGDYTYSLTFDVPAADLATASFSGGWSSDNQGIGITLNGSSIAGATSVSQFSAGYVAFATSEAGSGFFVSGANTLLFSLRNEAITGGDPTFTPTGLRVEFAPIPEPTTVVAGALLLLPFAASTLRFVRKRRTA